MISSKNLPKTSLALVLAAVTSCAPLATIKKGGAKYQPVHGAGEVAAAKTHVKTDPERALGDYLEAAREASLALKANPKDDTARKDYNYAVARAVEVLISISGDTVRPFLKVPSDSGEFHVTVTKPANKSHYKLKDLDVNSADTIVVGGKYFKDRSVIQGVGAPFVGLSKEMNKNYREEFTYKYDFGTATAVIYFSGPGGRTVLVEFLRPLNKDHVTLDGHTYPLSSDVSAPLALVMARERPEKLGLARMLNPEKYNDTTRLLRLQPYEPKRIPVIFTHGLQDTPASWAPMINTLIADEEIREHYQFWVFSYPSGYPYPYSAALMRKQLDAMNKAYPDHKKLVLVGHSMGGCVSRLMITDSGDKIWMDLFGKEPAQTNMPASSRELFEQSLIFEHRKDVSRVVFLSAPLKGADMATGWIGRLGSSLVRAPLSLVKLTASSIAMLKVDDSALKLHRLPNSIDTLAPNNRFVRSVNKIPVTPGIPYHVIEGDRGKGGNKDKTSPVMSDGVVPYWSSHMDGAQSELIVPSNHGTPRNPQAIQEVRRILKLHLKSSS